MGSDVVQTMAVARMRERKRETDEEGLEKECDPLYDVLGATWSIPQARTAFQSRM